MKKLIPNDLLASGRKQTEFAVESKLNLQLKEPLSSPAWEIEVANIHSACLFGYKFTSQRLFTISSTLHTQPPFRSQSWPTVIYLVKKGPFVLTVRCASYYWSELVVASLDLGHIIRNVHWLLPSSVLVVTFLYNFHIIKVHRFSLSNVHGITGMILSWPLLT